MVEIPRRIVLIGAAAAPLVACGKAAEPPTKPTAAIGQALTPVADVGQAKVVDGILITQPSPGVYKGFDAKCTHLGCAVVVKNGGIECPCHGSKFNLDGSVATGPAKAPLAAQPITVRDGQIVAT